MIITRDRSVSRQAESSSIARFRADVMRGLGAPTKELPSKYFYDEAGSELFERITQLEEYYLTRTELSIMKRHVAEMADRLGPRCLLIEYGSGSSLKTRLLFDHLHEPAGYVPIDVSGEHLRRSTEALSGEYPSIEMLPLDADFTCPVRLPEPRRQAERRVVYFPGSTIGNLTPDEATALLRQTAALCGPGGKLLLGADLRKDRRVLEAAYDDTQGVTALFNRNILVRINRELQTDFVVDQYRHKAFYNALESRIEMHLVSLREQFVHLGTAEFSFTVGESIRTEYSHKYGLRDLRSLAQASGFRVEDTWLDDARYFSVLLLTVT
jgi:dimethylhistidine N-methyltransferase